MANIYTIGIFWYNWWYYTKEQSVIILPQFLLSHTNLHVIIVRTLPIKSNFYFLPVESQTAHLAVTLPILLYNKILNLQHLCFLVFVSH